MLKHKDCKCCKGAVFTCSNSLCSVNGVCRCYSKDEKVKVINEVYY